LDGKRKPETLAEDVLIRRFLIGTFNNIYSSEFIIKRHMNTINISFLVSTFRRETNKIYFLVGYSEELLSTLLKRIVKLNVQSVINKKDTIFKIW
jgi:small subunit ribosomal protein S24